jgi:hypothetical protein
MAPLEQHLSNTTGWSNAEMSRAYFVATFTRTDDGSQIVLPGFWAGKDGSGNGIWKFRFTPNAAGKTWKWSVSAWSDDHQTYIHPFGRPAGTTGSVTASAADPNHYGGNAKHGFLTTNGKDVQYSDGTQLYLWGNTAYHLVDNVLQKRQNIARMHTFVDQSKAHGMTKIRMGLAWALTAAPWENCNMGTEEGYPDYIWHFDAFNTGYWDAWDMIIQYMQSKGVVAELVLFHDVGPDDSMGPMSITDEQKYMKYAVARYAAYTNVIWCLTNEWGSGSRQRWPERDFPPGSNPNNTGNCSWHPEWISGGTGRDNNYEPGLGPFMKNNTGADPGDPYIIANGRLISAHQQATMPVNGVSGPRVLFDFWGDSWPTHGVIQGPAWLNGNSPFSYSHQATNWAILQNLSVTHKPIFDDEYGYDIGNREDVRKAAWGAAVAGGYGSYGEMYGWPNSGIGIGIWNDQYP